MLFATYQIMRNVALPQLAVYGQILLEAGIMIFILVMGIIMMFGAVGMRISTNLGSTIFRAIFSAIGWVARQMVRLLSWIVVSILHALPRIFRGSRRMLRGFGVNNIASNLLAIVITVIALAVII